jgi:hypothetical protein
VGLAGVTPIALDITDPALIAKLTIDGIEAGDAEIIADETSRRILTGLSAEVTGLYPRSPEPSGDSQATARKSVRPS